MGISSSDKQKYIKRLLKSRMRILSEHGFYGLLLMHMSYSIDEGCPTAYTDGERIAFGPEFLDSLSDEELDFIMMHEIMHVVLKHCFRFHGGSSHQENVAADIVVNSLILQENGMDLKSITLSEHGVSMHLAPDGTEGYIHTMEEVVGMILVEVDKKKDSGKGVKGKSGGSSDGIDEDDSNDSDEGYKDDHSKWGKASSNRTLRDVWDKRIADACEAISIRDASSGRDTLPLLAKRLWKELTSPKLDWRTILNEFVQPDINDYSFSPPDRRFSESPFFLPDLNGEVEDEVVSDILFMIDTSGSMSDELITSAYSEIKGAMDQFGGKLKGWLGFFDTDVAAPVPFNDEASLLEIKPYGGGGTDFDVVFKYIRDNMMENPPSCIIVLTDGYAPFPEESAAMGIPVLWLINNDEITPPWGKIARIEE